MDIPYVRGRVASQAHVGLPEGTYEEEYARNGFFGRYAHLYRTHAPVGWTSIEGPLMPRAYDLRPSFAGDAAGGEYFGARVPLLGNDDVRLSSLAMASPMTSFARSADADTLLFVHAGAGRLETDFGPLPYQPGDYLYVPRGTVFRLAPSSASELLCIESYGEITIPDRGMLGQHALFDPAVLRVPVPEEGSTLGPDHAGQWSVKIERQGQLTTVRYPFCPLDVVGWKGTLAPFVLNVRDIRPVLSDRYHLPPSAHTTFLLKDAVICTFAPRPMENGDPDALKVPFYHSNIDFDEVLFYHRGEFFSRAGIETGMLTFHPQGIHHGPHPKAFERSRKATRTEEVAVMLDTRRPLSVLSGADRLAIAGYEKSWSSEP